MKKINFFRQIGRTDRFVHLSQEIYQKGISLTKKAFEVIEMRLLRNPSLPKWDILIRPC